MFVEFMEIVFICKFYFCIEFCFYLSVFILLENIDFVFILCRYWVRIVRDGDGLVRVFVFKRFIV